MNKSSFKVYAFICFFFFPNKLTRLQTLFTIYYSISLGNTAHQNNKKVINMYN